MRAELRDGRAGLQNGREHARAWLNAFERDATTHKAARAGIQRAICSSALWAVIESNSWHLYLSARPRVRALKRFRPDRQTVTSHIFSGINRNDLVRYKHMNANVPASQKRQDVKQPFPLWEEKSLLLCVCTRCAERDWH